MRHLIAGALPRPEEEERGEVQKMAKAVVATEAMRASRVEKGAAGADVLMISGEQWAAADAP